MSGLLAPVARMSLFTSLAHHVLVRYANRYGLAYPILTSRQPRFTMISSRQPERASAYINQHLRDPDDPSGLILDISSTTDLLDRLRFSSLILEEGTIRSAVPRNSTLLCPRSWISAPMDMPFTRRVNGWQFLNLLGLWIHRTTGNFRKTLRNGRDTPRCWNSLTRYQTDRVGLYYSSILQSGFVARSQLRIGLILSILCLR